MLVIKVGGSIFVPKNSDTFDTQYLQKLSCILKTSYPGDIALLHGTGNVGHGFVQRYGINKDTFDAFLKNRDGFFARIDEQFSGFSRVPGAKILTEGASCILGKGNIISGGDAWTDTYEIIGSDDLFAELIKDDKNGIHISLTDVDGVFDAQGNTIALLKLSQIDTIPFWEKPGDVTNSMKGKLQALKSYIHPQSQGVWICNGFDLENVANIIKTGNGKGTLVVA